MSVIIQGDQVRTILEGIRVETAAITVPQAGAEAVFTVAGGRVLVKNLVGEVTTVIGGTTPQLNLTHASTVGGDIEFATDTSITSDEVGTLYAVNGVGNALGVGSSGVVESSHNGVVLAEGTVNMEVDAADATGAIQWVVTYVPLDTGASITAA